MKYNCTIYRAIRVCQERIPCLNLHISGVPWILTELKANGSARQKIDVSTRKLAKCYRVPHMTVQQGIGRNGTSFRKIKIVLNT